MDVWHHPLWTHSTLTYMGICAHTHTRKHARTHACTHTRTHREEKIIKLPVCLPHVQEPSFTFTEEYQVDFMSEYHNTFDKFRSQFLVGEMVWNFADFMTIQGKLAVAGLDPKYIQREAYLGSKIYSRGCLSPLALLGITPYTFNYYMCLCYVLLFVCACFDRLCLFDG